MSRVASVVVLSAGLVLLSTVQIIHTSSSSIWVDKMTTELVPYAYTLVRSYCRSITAISYYHIVALPPDFRSISEWYTYSITTSSVVHLTSYSIGS